MGDFTDWVPFTMHMHAVLDMQQDPSKQGEFFVVVKLAKGFKYRYLFEIDSNEIVDEKSPKDKSKEGKLTNFIEVKSAD